MADSPSSPAIASLLPVARPGPHPFEDGGDTHSTSGAHRNQPAAATFRCQELGQNRHDSRARRSKGMTEGD